MSEKVNVAQELQRYFFGSKGKPIKVEGTIHKVHVDELTGEDVSFLYSIVVMPKFKDILIKRSGTGMTVIIDVNPG